MRITIQSDDANITPGGYKTFNVELECDTKDVVNQLSPGDVISCMPIDELLDGIGDDVCVGHFGTRLLEQFTIDEVLEYHTIEDIIKHLGHDKFKSYIREIFIDKIIEK